MSIAALARNFVGAVAVSAAALGLAPAMAQTPITVVFATSSTLNHIPFYIALAEGFFKEEGLDVKGESVGGSAEALQALISGQAQLANAGPGPFFAAISRGEGVTFVYNYYRRNTFALTVPADLGISGPEGLKGKTIGVDSMDGPQIALARGIMRDVGLTEGNDYQILNIGEGGMAVAGFSRGDIHAYTGSAEDSAIMKSRGVKLIDITPAKFANLFGNGYIAKNDWLAANKDAMAKFGRALAKASRFAADPANKARAIEIGKARNPLEYQDEAVIAEQFDEVVGKFKPADGVMYGSHDPAAWEAWHQSMLRSETLKAPLPDLAAVYTNEFVEEWNK